MPAGGRGPALQVPAPCLPSAGPGSGAAGPGRAQTAVSSAFEEDSAFGHCFEELRSLSAEPSWNLILPVVGKNVSRSWWPSAVGESRGSTCFQRGGALRRALPSPLGLEGSG